MEGLFYSENDKRLFFIPNYYTHGTGTLENLRKNLTDGESKLRQFVKEGEIYCDEIRESRRYKSMWYFSIDCHNPPEEAFKLGKDWTLYKWIRG